MMEDIRNHDAQPTPTEIGWMSVDAVEVIVKSLVLAAIALTIGISASLTLQPVAGATSYAASANPAS